MYGGFSVLLPVKGKADELGRMDESVLSAIRLGPDQIIFGTDEGCPDLERRLRLTCEQAGYAGPTIVSVPRSPAWGFQLAHVVWHCIKASRHDRILLYNADSRLLPAVMKGGGQVGRGGVAVASHTIRLRLRTPLDLVRHASYRIWVRRNSYVFTGTFWIWRPYVLEALRMADYASIGNLVDDKIAAAVRASRYSVVTNKEAGSAHFALQNTDLPWRQFQVGVWLRTYDLRARRECEARWARANKRPFPRRLYLRFRQMSHLLRFCAFSVRPYCMRGYLWALRHPGHEAVRAAARMGISEWEHAGSAYLEGIAPAGDLEGTGARTG